MSHRYTLHVLAASAGVALAAVATPALAADVTVTPPPSGSFIVNSPSGAPVAYC
jgi:hypothetical protein